MSDTLKTTSMVALFGELLCDDKKEKNDWKKRMFEATGLLDFPSDWDSLTEDEKETRLNKVIKIGRRTNA
jgi:hypothetical protein